LNFSGVSIGLQLFFDGNDTFSVAAGEFYSQAGNVYTFYSDPGHTTEIAKVTLM
jgi:hypothetical protein